MLKIKTKKGSRFKSHHIQELIIGNIVERLRTRSSLKNHYGMALSLNIYSKSMKWIIKREKDIDSFV